MKGILLDTHLYRNKELLTILVHIVFFSLFKFYQRKINLFVK